jgi:hypothetical protein
MKLSSRRIIYSGISVSVVQSREGIVLACFFVGAVVRLDSAATYFVEHQHS